MFAAAAREGFLPPVIAAFKGALSLKRRAIYRLQNDVGGSATGMAFYYY